MWQQKNPVTKNVRDFTVIQRSIFRRQASWLSDLTDGIRLPNRSVAFCIHQHRITVVGPSMIRTLFPLPREYAPVAPTENLFQFDSEYNRKFFFCQPVFSVKKGPFFSYIFLRKSKFFRKFFRKNFSFCLLTKNINAHIMGAEFHNRLIQVSFSNESNGNRVRIPDGPATV